MDTCCSAQSTISTESQPRYRLAHKSSCWARSATVSAKRERAKSFVPGPTTPDQKTKRTTLRKSNLANANTSLSAMCWRDLSFLKVKDLQLTACRCSQRYSAAERMILDFNFKVFWHHTCYAKNFDFKLSYKWAIFESFSKFTPRNDGFVIFRDVSFDDAFVLFIFFSFMLKQRCLFHFYNMTRLPRTPR